MKELFRYKIILSYDGTNYCGWQVQPTATSIQTIVQEAVGTILQHKVGVTGSGRTDSGVHAIGQTAHFSCEKTITSPSNFIYSLNGLLPTDIRVMEIEEVPTSFHARYSTIGKTYYYHIFQGKYIDPFLRLYRYHCLYRLDIDILKLACKKFVGTHDFTSFANEANKGSAATTPVKTINRLDYVKETNGFRLEFEGTGFLYKMVRNIVGTLIDIARGKIDIKTLDNIFKAKDRKQAGTTAPAHGLFLMQAHYDNASSNNISSKDS
jgi:tRNA pseudouridine38-40 synthase